MLTQEINDRLNGQMGAEYFSERLYLAMSGWAKEQYLNGFADWLFKQAQEERTHGDRIFHYIPERFGKIRLGALPQPPEKWDSIAAVFENAFEQEKFVTSEINRLVEQAEVDKDWATTVFLEWFVTEQVEEERQTFDILRQIEAVKDSPAGLLVLDFQVKNLRKD